MSSIPAAKVPRVFGEVGEDGKMMPPAPAATPMFERAARSFSDFKSRLASDKQFAIKTGLIALGGLFVLQRARR